MREATIQELRNVQLDILKNVDTFCKANGLRYSLCGGSMLGAVRHKGYIPWDDDIDIMMPRPDYDRFVATFSSDVDYIIDFEKQEAFRETFVKICRKDTLMVDDLLQRGAFGINIDLFPIDGVPSDKSLEYVEDVVARKEEIAKFCPFYKEMRSKKVLWMLKYWAKRIAYCKTESILKLKADFHTHLCKTPFETSELAGVISGSYGKKEIVKKGVFIEYEEMPFEDSSFMAISRYDEYLGAIYGDYMKLPPVEKRTNPHHYHVYISD